MTLGRPEQLLAVLIMEAALGYPRWLLCSIGHPVMWVGRVIAALDRYWNRGDGRVAKGALAALILIAMAAAAGLLVERLAAAWFGTAILVLIATTGIAQRSLWDHVKAVALPLDQGDPAAARAALSRVVGRDTATLDEAGIAAAAIETLAESFCDGVLAPAFWFAVFGLPGLFVFKAINTADSMIGHRDARHELFGKASARLDDALNWVPARLAGLLLCVASGTGWRIMRRDARRHLSPNAGWPESAMAGALGVTLGGGAAYDGEWIARETLGDGSRPLAPDLRRALTIYLRACAMLWLLVGALAWLSAGSPAFLTRFTT
jgi:adenosylcobinamide-phosphate synthase